MTMESGAATTDDASVDEDEVIDLPDPTLDAAVEPSDETDEAEVDPFAARDAAIAGLEQRLNVTTAALARMSSAVGRVPTLVNDLQALRDSNPTASLTARIDQLQDEFDLAIDNLDAIAMNENGRTTLTQRRAARAESQRMAKLRDELEAKFAPKASAAAAPVETGEIEAPDAEFDAAAARIAGYAEAKGIDPTKIPAETLAFKVGETVAVAEARVKAAINTMAGTTASTTRVAERRTAAGGGALSPAAVTTQAKQQSALLQKAASGVPLAAAEQKALEAALVAAGVTL